MERTLLKDNSGQEDNIETSVVNMQFGDVAKIEVSQNRIHLAHFCFSCDKHLINPVMSMDMPVHSALEMLHGVWSYSYIFCFLCPIICDKLFAPKFAVE